MSQDPPLTWSDLDELEVEVLRGVGEKRSAALAAVDVHTVGDLLRYYPRRYVDRSREARVADVVPGEEALVVAAVTHVDARRTRSRKSVVEVRIEDDTGTLRCTFFNQAWRSRQLSPGMTAAFFGKVDLYRQRPQMVNPLVDLVGDRTGRIVPIYPQSEKAGLTTWEVAGWVAEALRRAGGRGIADPVPDDLRRRHGLLRREEALQQIHLPATMSAKDEARRRLVFDELLRVQFSLVRRKRELEETLRGIVHVVDGPLVDAFLDRLPFALTAAQGEALATIGRDLERPSPMHRLLQGDVGSGKTVVAVGAMLSAVDGGHQAALMAPTEVLAEQHHLAVADLLSGLEVVDPTRLGGTRPLAVELLVNRLGAADRRRVLAGLADGSVDLVVGTHALIQEGVAFRSLGVVVVDEQHRFGVEQRDVLRRRGRPDDLVPDVLVMTATPIPRTAAMTVYGDLDVSVLDELPPGRTPISTEWVRAADAGGMWERVRHEVGAGRQAYVVCPLIEESDKLEARSAQATFDELTGPEGALAGLRVGLLHGRLAAADKAMTMELFRSGRLDVLVATTVVEVGVDVPNATVMVILSADRFGIAQLHQLRGRVGRGTAASTCSLVTDDEAAGPAGARIEALVASTDGFALAEKDLELRGEGTLFAVHQSGRNDLQLASLVRDAEWVGRAREAAVQVLDADPDLSAHPLLAAEIDWFEAWVDGRHGDAGGPPVTEFLLKS